MEAGGHVLVTVSRDCLQQCAYIRVEDSGIGISPEILGNIFEPFLQVNTTLDRSGDGLGLGLALVNGLVKLHGGSVTASSDGPGTGSIFALRLPLFIGQIIVAENEIVATASHNSKRVLVIEDNRDVAESLRSLLEIDGHTVFLAPDGYQVAREFRASKDLRNVYLISLTGYTRPDDLRRAREAGFQSQLIKPVDLDTLRITFALVH